MVYEALEKKTKITMCEITGLSIFFKMILKENKYGHFFPPKFPSLWKPAI